MIPTLLLGGSAALTRQRAFLLENEFADDAAHPGCGSGHGEQIAFAAAHTDREQHIKDWQNVCIMASENALSADFTTDDDVEWPLQEGNAESSLQIVV